MRKSLETSKFKPGQIVTQKRDGHKSLFKVPDADYWKQQRPLWLHIPFYAKLTEEGFVAEKMRTQIDFGCFDCMDRTDKECHSYVLVCLDPQGNEMDENEIDTHVCEKTLKLAKKRFRP